MLGLLCYVVIELLTTFSKLSQIGFLETVKNALTFLHVFDSLFEAFLSETNEILVSRGKYYEYHMQNHIYLKILFQSVSMLNKSFCPSGGGTRGSPCLRFFLISRSMLGSSHWKFVLLTSFIRTLEVSTFRSTPWFLCLSSISPYHVHCPTESAPYLKLHRNDESSYTITRFLLFRILSCINVCTFPLSITEK